MNSHLSKSTSKALRPSRAKSPPRAAPTPRRRLLAALCLACALAAAGYLAYSWHQWTRPGMAHYLRGMEYADKKDMGAAVREWQLGIQTDPRSAGCYEQLGSLYMALRRYGEAGEVYAKATRYFPDDGAMFLSLARCQQLQKDSIGAEASARRAARLMPQNGDALGLYGILAQKNKESPTAIAALRRAHALKPANTDYLMALVYAEVDTGEMQGAERDLAPLVQAHPDDAQACFLMAVINNQKPRTPETLRTALDYAQRAWPGMKGDMRIYSMMGTLYLDSGQPREALRVFTTGQRIAPQSEVILHGLQDSYARLGDAAKAARYGAILQAAAVRHDRIEHLKHVMGFNHNDTTSGLELARLEEQDGDTAQALTYYRQLVRQAPDDPRTRPALAAFLRRTGRPDLARQVLRPNFTP